MGRTAPETGGSAQATGTNGDGMGTTGVAAFRIIYHIIRGLGRWTMKFSCRLVKLLSLALALGLVRTTLPVAQPPDSAQPRGIRDMLEMSTMKKEGDIILISTGKSLFPEPADSPYRVPPGTNFLPTIFTNMFDAHGKEMPNTLPSTPT